MVVCLAGVNALKFDLTAFGHLCELQPVIETNLNLKPDANLTQTLVLTFPSYQVQ
jgi:hypothetical protein